MKTIIFIMITLILTSCQYFQKLNDPHAEIQIGHYVKLRQLNQQNVIWIASYYKDGHEYVYSSDTIFKYPGQVISLYQTWEQNVDGNNYYNVRDGWGHVYKMPIANIDDKGVNPYIDKSYNDNRGLIK